MNKIYILDVTNRDGVQTSRLGLSKIEKTVINILLNEMGVSQSEFGFPFTNHELNYLNANLDLAEIGKLKPIKLSGWLRATLSDVELAFKNVPKLKHLNLSISTSDQMIVNKFKGKLDRKAIIKEMTVSALAAKKHGVETLGVNAEDASRTDIEYLLEFAHAARDAGADRLRYCDTLGYDDPSSIYERISRIAKEVKIDIELHCHNDLGLAVATSISGAAAANDQGRDAYINTTVNGMGERAGNCDLVSVLLAIKKASYYSRKYVLDEKINLLKAWQLAKYGAYAFSVPIPINQPGVGSNAFAHESGIHADGALKDRRNYELYDFEELGRGEPEVIETGRMITVGEYSGIKGFRNVFDKLEIEFKNDEEAKMILELVRYANVETQKPLTNHELIFIAQYPEIARKLMTLTP